jgi:transcriptional regulator with XRE-family HTH domain
MIEDVLSKVKSVRERKGLSHEYMGMKLGISQAAYTKIERGQTNLALDRLYQIAEVLDVKIAELLGIDLKSEFNQTNNDGGIGYLQKEYNFYQENKEQYQKIIELYESRLADKDALIEVLRKG